jgi:hypothetical protein
MPSGVTFRMRKPSATKTNPSVLTASPASPIDPIVEKEAAVPTPSAPLYPASAPEIVIPPPANVVTIPPGVTLRMRGPSATKMLPLVSRAILEGPSNKAAEPTPSAYDAQHSHPQPPWTQLPTKVVTTPLGVTLRMRRLTVSATTTVPLASTATSLGREKEAPVPVPSANASAPLPASVLTTPPGVTLRTRWLCESATCTLPP